jgi:methylmalonyl-CoA mutase N-terminal domain/subunit
MQSLAAVLGGTQSLHVSGYDEAYDIPSEDAMRMSLATQLIIAHETGVTNTVDPLGGSYYLESLTSNLEEKAGEYVRQIEDIGEGSILRGMLDSIRSGYIEGEIANAAHEYQQRIENKEYTIVGVNDYRSEESQRLETFQYDPQEEARQLARLRKAKRTRSNSEVTKALDMLRRAAGKNENVMPFVLKDVQSIATEGEIMGVLREVYGEYTDRGVF